MSVLTTEPPQTPPQRQTIHLSFLDGLRGLAAVYVMFHHAWLTVWSDPANFPRGVIGLMTRWLAFGHMAVAVFIVLSGFCLMLPVVRGGGELRGGSWNFFKRRARRIIPPYYLAILLSSILIATTIGGPSEGFWGMSVPHGKREWLKALATHLTLVEDFLDYKKINYVFWSVAVEWQIYFLFPLMVIGWRRLGAVATTAVAMILAYAVAIALNSHDRFRQVHINYVGLFALGGLGATLAFGPNKPKRIPWRWIGVAAAAGALGICFWGIDHFNALLMLVDFFVATATTSLLIAACENGRDPFRAVLSAGPVVWIGTFSYSLYLIHAPLLQIIWKYLISPLDLPTPETFALLALGGAPIIIAASYIFYLACERPFLTRRPGAPPR